MLNIVELLALRGLNTQKKIKLVRHQDKRFDINELVRNNLIELYQSYQSKPVFECDYIVSFLGMERSKARFMGVYKVIERKSAKEFPLPQSINHLAFAALGDFFYVLEEVNGFEDFKWRIVIDWGKSTLAWHQKLSKKEVIEILPVGYVKEFPGFLNFVLRFDEVVSLINFPDVNREWHQKLSSVAGIYLITDVITGKQYIGSAYGAEGILGRWKYYVKKPDGGNKQLEELLKVDINYARNFQFTILQTLPTNLTEREVIKYEVLYKKKLGSKAFGLNSN